MTDTHSNEPEHLVLAGPRRWAEISRVADSSLIEVYGLWRAAYGPLVRVLLWVLTPVLLLGVVWVLLVWAPFAVMFKDGSSLLGFLAVFRNGWPDSPAPVALLMMVFGILAIALLVGCIALTVRVVRLVLSLGATEVVLDRADRSAPASQLRKLLADLDREYDRASHRELIRVARVIAAEREAQYLEEEAAHLQEYREQEEARRRNDWV